jgi:hypothetical protein
MRISQVKFVNATLLAAIASSFMAILPAEAKRGPIPVDIAPVTAPRQKPAVAAPSVAIPTPSAPTTQIPISPADRRDAQVILEYSSSFNRAVQNIGPASDALVRMFGEATPSVLTLTASERAGKGNSWVASIARQTGLARAAFEAMGPAPTVSNPDLQRQMNGLASARRDVLAILETFDQSAKRLSALVLGWSPERNDAVVASLNTERTLSQSTTMRAFAATNTAIAAGMVPEAPSQHINLMMASMYNVGATTVDVRVGKVTIAQAVQLISQQTANMRLQSPQGRRKVVALQAQLRNSLATPGLSEADRSKTEIAISAIGEYNKAFDIADRITTKLDQIRPLLLSRSPATFAQVDLIIRDISTLEYELLDIIRHVTRRLST